MSTAYTIWMILAGAIGLVWVARIVLIAASIRHRIVLGSRSYDGPPEPAPFLSVLVAAKDEEDNIESCVTTLLDQDYPNYEVIAIDDRSSDATPAILRRLEEQANGKLRVITITQLREGWFGKNNAMREGVEAARGDWLCFTDADCRQVSRNSLSMAMREATTHECDFLSVTPVLDMDYAWTKVLQPVCALILIVWFLPTRVNNPRKKTAYANGAFMLMKQSCYETIGGHERARAHVNEDIEMARAAKEAGLRLRVVENDDMYRTRMYRTVGEAWRGWSRIFYGCLQTMPRLLTATALVCTMTILPWVSLGTAAIGRIVASSENVAAWNQALLAWGVVVFLVQSVTWRFYGMLRAPRAWSITYVLGAIVAAGMLINAMLKQIGAVTTTWRGTTYRGDQLVTGTGSTTTDTPADAGIERTKETKATPVVTQSGSR